MKKQKINEIDNLKTDKLIYVCLRITQNNDCPALEIRQLLTDYELIKIIISSAFTENPVIIYPVFRNRILAINTLIEKGIIHREGDKYYFVL